MPVGCSIRLFSSTMVICVSSSKMQKIELETARKHLPGRLCVCVPVCWLFGAAACALRQAYAELLCSLAGADKCMLIQDVLSPDGRHTPLCGIANEGI